MAGSDEQRGSDGASSADAPGPLSRLLEEIAQAPGNDLLAAWQDQLKPGDRLDRFEIRREIGRGGFGAVYEAFDSELGRVVAVKTLRPGRSRRELSADWLKKEAEAVARLDHPCIVTLFDMGTCPSGPYLVMELLRGETLSQRIEKGPLPMGKALGIAEEMAKGLAHAHQCGVLHRDLKPANVFLCEDRRVKLLDFGLAHLLGSPRERGAGTPAYMAPEQARGDEVDARADVYAAGKVLEEMLGERRPRRLDQVVAFATSVAPAARPRDGTAWLDLLQSARRAGERPSRIRRIALIAGTGIILGAAVAGLAVRRSLRPPEATQSLPPPSIAVLPFADMSPQHDQEYFSDGIAEEILNALSHIEGLKVAGHTSSFSFKGKGYDAAAIAGKLHVAHLLEGSVRKEGNRVRISAQLVSARDGFHLWSESFDRELTDVFAVQDEIARAVVDALKVKLMPGRAPSTKGYQTSNPEAHRQYLLGRHFWNMLSLEGDRRAIQAQEKALALDPSYAPAWAGLAMALFDQGDLTMKEGTFQEGCRRALEAAEKAVALDPELAESYSTRGFLRSACNWDWAGAKTDLELALTLNPGDVLSQRRYGGLQLLTGRPADALPPTRKAIEIDPLVPLTWRWLGITYMAMGDSGSAREALNQALQILPEDPYAKYLLAVTFLLEAQPAAALNAIERSRGDHSNRLAVLALAHHDLGQRRESQQALEALHARLAEGDTYAAYDLARVHAWVGERDRALEWLERARARQEGDIYQVKVDPLLRDLHGDPRYVAILRKMNLPAD